MRGHPLRVLMLAVVAALVAGPAQADGEVDPSLQLVIVEPGALRVGERRSIELQLQIAPDARAPLLVTPVSEGSAVDVVRGRLFRSDAVEAGSGALRLQVPIAVRAQGASVLRVDVLTYTCGVRCRALRASASVPLVARAP